MTKDVEKIFQDFLTESLSVDEPDFERMIAAHPEQAKILREKAAAYRRMKAALPRLSFDSENDPFIGKTFGGCRIKSLIRRGGMGLVYLATQESLKRDVALKILHPSVTNTEASFGRFRRESQNIARLDHENILPVHDVGTQDGIHYVITKYVSGVSLEDVIHLYRDKGVPPSPEDIAKLLKTDLTHWKYQPKDYLDFVNHVIVKTAVALAFTHSRSIIHRDVKPSNILLKDDGEPVLIDFGLSRDYAQSTITMTGEYMGTPVYSAPEQLFGLQEEVDERADVYSLGMTFYELATGKLPFSGRTFLDMVSNIKTERPIDPIEYNSKIPPFICDVILKSIKTKIEERFQSMLEFSNAILEMIDSHSDKTAPTKFELDTSENIQEEKFEESSKISASQEFNDVTEILDEISPHDSDEYTVTDDAPEKSAKLQDRPFNFIPIVIFILLSCVLLIFSKAYFLTDKEEPSILSSVSNTSTSDEIEAEDNYRKAAAQGDSNAQFELGMIYDNNHGNSQKYNVKDHNLEAAMWFGKAAEQGHRSAQFYFGTMYNNGDGVGQDKKEAVKWFLKAAEQGDVDAQRYLSRMYDEGDGVLQDKNEALYWKNRAIGQNDANARMNSQPKTVSKTTQCGEFSTIRTDLTEYDTDWKIVYKSQEYPISSYKENSSGFVVNVGCDSFIENKSWLRIDTFSGGAHCCTNSYWFPANFKGRILFSVGHDGDPPEDGYEIKSNDKGTKFIEIGDNSIMYFGVGDFFLGGAAGGYLPMNICYDENNDRFYDCTATTISDYDKAKLLKDARSGIKEYEINLIEYLGLGLLFNNRYDQSISDEIPYNRAQILPDIIREIEVRLARRKYSVGAYVNLKPDYALKNILNLSETDITHDIEKTPNELAALGFYQSLQNNDYKGAINYLVPDKRNRGAYQVSSMSAYYDTLKSPIKVKALRERMDHATVFVETSYMNSNDRECISTSDVQTINQAGRILIKRITPLTDSCQEEELLELKGYVEGLSNKGRQVEVWLKSFTGTILFYKDYQSQESFGNEFSWSDTPGNTDRVLLLYKDQDGNAVTFVDSPKKLLDWETTNISYTFDSMGKTRAVAINYCAFGGNTCPDPGNLMKEASGGRGEHGCEHLTSYYDANFNRIKSESTFTCGADDVQMDTFKTKDLSKFLIYKNAMEVLKKYGIPQNNQKIEQ